MKEYTKPYIEDEDIEIEDICFSSQADDTINGKLVDPWDDWE